MKYTVSPIHLEEYGLLNLPIIEWEETQVPLGYDIKTFNSKEEALDYICEVAVSKVRECNSGISYWSELFGRAMTEKNTISQVKRI